MGNAVRKISEEQVNQLFTFTRKHFVEYYDLQNELVDHMANAIEEKWKQEPGLSFENALKAEFKKFGIFGFMNVVERRQVALSKKYHKLLWGYFREFFKLPKIMLTIAMIFALVKSFQLIHPVVFAIVFAGSILFSLGYVIFLNIKYHKRVKKTGRRWMLEEIIYRCGGAGTLFYLPIHFGRFIFNGEQQLLGQCIIATGLVCFLLYQYIMLFVVVSKAEKLLEETYPEYAFYNMSKKL